MKLLYTKRSPYARKVRMIALEKGIHLELIDEDLQKKSQQLLEANPLGKVPTLILDNGDTVYDSPVICQYLDSLNDQNIMIPKDLQSRVKVLKWEALADDLIVSGINSYMETVRHPKDLNQDFLSAQAKNIQMAYVHIEKHLDDLKLFNLSVIALVSAIGYIHLRLPHLKVQGKLAQWFEEFSKRPSMQQTVPVV